MSDRVGYVMMMIMIVDNHLAVLDAAALLMCEEATAVAVRGAACLAHIRLLARMGVCVLLQRAEPLEGFAARFTQIICLAGVSSQVSAKSRTHGECGTAYVTDERLVARMNTNVIRQTRRRREAAIARLAHVRLNAGVSSHVICEG